MTNIGSVGTNMAVVDPDRGGGGVPPFFRISRNDGQNHQFYALFWCKIKNFARLGRAPHQNYRSGSTTATGCL